MLPYLQHYAPSIQAQVHHALEEKRLKSYLLSSYPTPHTIQSDKALYTYVTQQKRAFIKGGKPLEKVCYDSKIRSLHTALGTHTRVSRQQGGKLKAKREIRISTLFKATPQAFLEMIVAHELAHLKVQEHSKAFYQLATHICPNYHQYEFDLRVYLTYQSMEKENLWSRNI